MKDLCRMTIDVFEVIVVPVSPAMLKVKGRVKDLLELILKVAIFKPLVLVVDDSLRLDWLVNKDVVLEVIVCDFVVEDVLE